MLAANEGLTADHLAELQDLTGARRLSCSIKSLATILGGATSAAAGNGPVFNDGMAADSLAELAQVIGYRRFNAWGEIFATILGGVSGAAASFGFVFREGDARNLWNEGGRRTANIVEIIAGAATGRAYRACLQNSAGGRRVRCPSQAKLGAISDRTAATVNRHLRPLRLLGLVHSEPRSRRNKKTSGGRRLADRMTVCILAPAILETTERLIAQSLGVSRDSLLALEPFALYRLRQRQAADLAIVDRSGVIVPPPRWRPPMKAKAASVCRRLVDSARQACGAAAAGIFASILAATNGGLKTARLGQEEIAKLHGLSRGHANRLFGKLREHGFIDTAKQAAEGKRYRDQVGANLSESDLAEREAEDRRGRQSRLLAAWESARNTFPGIGAHMRAVQAETDRRRAESQASHAIRAGKQGAARHSAGEDLEGFRPIGAAGICNMFAGALVRNQNLEKTATVEAVETAIQPKPPPQKTETYLATIDQKLAAETAEGRGYADKLDLRETLARFRARFEAGKGAGQTAGKAEGAHARPRTAELMARCENALEAIESLRERGGRRLSGRPRTPWRSRRREALEIG